MADIIPFKALRPRTDLIEKIAALPYDVYSREEARRKVAGDKYSFLRIDRPETQFPEGYDMYAPEVYEKAHDMLWEMVQKGEFVTEETPAYYVYELIMNGRSQTGICACASVEDYENQIIKKHENTRAEKEADRIRHVDICNAQTGPIFLAYRQREDIREQIEKAKKKRPLYHFTADDGIIHKVWIIDEEDSIKAIQEGFAKVDRVYIADGHHRCASAVKVSKKRREQNPGYTGKEAFHYFLSVIFPDDQLFIMDYNRVIKSLNSYTDEEFLARVSEIFDTVKAKEQPYHPARKGEMGMYLKDTWYKLSVKKGMVSGDPVKDLDVALLQDNLLEPVLGILDPKSDERIDFVGGIRGLEELERRVKTDCKAAFAMYPTDIHELFAVADAGKLMPPKSTWFEPKLRSGIFIHSLED